MDYDDQLDRAMDRTPDVQSAGDRFEVPDADLRIDGNFTVVENFPALTDALGREPAHVMQFLQSELGTAAQLDDNGRLRLTGNFRRAKVDDAVSAYVEGYVLCPECGLPDTKLVVEGDARMLKCDACGALSPTGE